MQSPKNFVYSTMINVSIIILLGITISCTSPQPGGTAKMGISETTQTNVVQQLVEKHGNQRQADMEKGVRQAAERWQTSDGSEKDFLNFCLDNYYGDEKQRQMAFTRIQKNLESIYGNMHKISRDLSWETQVDCGERHPIDDMFATFDPFAHVQDDLFSTKLAFVILLNYPITSLDEKNTSGMKWSREKWAESRLAEWYSSRVPAEVLQKQTEAYVKADDYISNYNIIMANLLDTSGNHLFPKGLKLITHWGLRDELKAQYDKEDGLPRQKMIQKVMERIILQETPQEVINQDRFDWNPYTNVIFQSGTNEAAEATIEPNTRYKHILNIFKSEQMVDRYRPDAPTKIARRFNINREISEEEVEAEFKSVLTAPVLKDIASLIKNRLGRDLLAFDIWYNGFKPKSTHQEEELDQITEARYPSTDAFQEAIPTTLRKLGFSKEKAKFLAQHIQVDPSRGAGHASGAMMKEDKAHLRTRIPEGGMKYKGFNIAIHELGHNVEQVFSLNGVDYYSLNGVPNTAFTEAFAFVFQSRDRMLLGLGGETSEAEHLRALQDIWATMEISAVALVDMYIWRWMYEHPKASDFELRNAAITIAKQVWNDYIAPVIGVEDQILLAVYSHIVDAGMYTPDYPLGHIISFQIEQYLKDKSLAEEMERMCRLGRLSPQIWMQKAVGQKVSALPLIEAAVKAVNEMKK